MSAGHFWRDVRTLLAHRQPVLAYLVAIAAAGTAVDLAAAGLRHQLHSFSGFARLEFDNVVYWRAFASLRDAPIGMGALVVLLVPAIALLAGWLRTCYLVALSERRYSLRAPRRTVLRLAVYFLVLQVIGTGLAGIFDNGQGAFVLLAQILLAPVLLFPDFAIVLDDVGVVEGVRRSLRVCRARPREALLVVFGFFLLSAVVAIAFTNGFTDSTHVQPSYLLAWLLTGVLLDFASDVVLLVLYRSTPLSAAGSAGPPEASRPSEASD